MERRHPAPLAARFVASAAGSETEARSAAAAARRRRDGEGGGYVQELAAPGGSVLLRAGSDGAAVCPRMILKDNIRL